MNALWWWIDRWRKSTAYTDMTLEEQGAYRNLLDEAWLRGGPLPADERILAKASGDMRRWPRIREKVLAWFVRDGNVWRNPTLDEVIHQSERRAEKQRRYRNKGGNAGGNAAGNNIGNTMSNEAGNKPGSPDPSPDQNVQNTRTAAAPPVPPVAREPSGDGNFKVIMRLAHSVMEESNVFDPTDPELTDRLKEACAKHRIDYGRVVSPDVIRRALVSAASQRLRGNGQQGGGVARLANELRSARTPEDMAARLKALQDGSRRR
jgi:uncharacterized protein YdaU (DUF1376 family)